MPNLDTHNDHIVTQAAEDYQLLIFDMDGVIVDSLMVMKMAFRASLFDYFGFSVTSRSVEALFSEYQKHLGKGFKQIMRELGLPEELSPYFVRHSRYLAAYVQPYQGMDELLKTLKKQGKTLCVATGKDGQRAGELLNRLSLLQYFDQVMGADQAPAKPDPTVLIDYMKYYDACAERTLMIGDAPADLLCAKRAGIASVAALWGYNKFEDLVSYQPKYYFHSPAQMNVYFSGRQP
ncbi:HAD family hydrolase [Marinomonas posidonica]|uniref:HAD family hydrolase n=1 Tax=Marinomonas posidonica TaxID=936476 RepID=UPI003734E391